MLLWRLITYYLILAYGFIMYILFEKGNKTTASNVNEIEVKVVELNEENLVNEEDSDKISE